MPRSEDAMVKLFANMAIKDLGDAELKLKTRTREHVSAEQQTKIELACEVAKQYVDELKHEFRCGKLKKMGSSLRTWLTILEAEQCVSQHQPVVLQMWVPPLFPQPGSLEEHL